MKLENALEKKCKEKGLRMTNQRRAVLAVLSTAKDHPTVEEILRRSRRIDKGVSMATVYRTVGLLKDNAIVHRIDLADGRARYEGMHEKEHHHHLIDVKTHELIEFSNPELERIKKKIAADYGYRIVGDRLALYVEKIKPGKK